MIRLLLASFAVAAQIAPDQLRSTPDAPTQLWAGTTSGFVPVRIGAGVALLKDANGYVLSTVTAPAPPAAITVQTFVLNAAVGGGYVTTAQVILRNNLPQIEGVDFKRVGGAIVFEKPVTPIDVIVGLKFILQPG